MSSLSRPLDIVLLGATGYTGKLCAEHIVKHHPTDLRWALAGRSAEKLNALSEELHKQAPDRKAPEILPVQLNDADLGDLARKTRVLINCVGPFHIFSSPVVAACADNGTHYLDITGEVPWIKQMINKYHESAKSKGTILISAVGMESVPADVLSWAMANALKEKYGVRTKEAIVSGYELKFSGISGGTLASALSLSQGMSSNEILASTDPHYIAVSPPATSKKAPLLERLFGARTVPHVGTVTSSIGSIIDVPVVQRGASLMTDLYDPDFRFWEYMNVSNKLVGALVHFALAVISLVVVIPPLRWLANALGPAQGTGPSEARRKKARLEFRGTATGTKSDGTPVRALGRLAYEGCPYTLTGLVATEAAMLLARNEGLVKDLGGGYLTPAMLRQSYVDRLQKAGVVIEAQVLE
ncbi:hypothetical protein VTO42DRAFT_3094 [Malbranchea cinnamomea]